MNEERLRRALAARDGTIRAGDACPSPEILWDLSAGRLDATTARAVGAHAAGCGACREALRIAREAGAVASGVPRRWVRWVAAAAAVVVLGMVAVVLREAAPRPPDPSEFREERTVLIESERSDSVARPGEPLVLRWTGIPGARYDLTVARGDLEVLTVARELERPEFVVPGEVLSRLAPGESLLWQVEASLADGRKVRSATFTVRMP